MSTGASDVILEASGVSRSFRGLQALADYNLRLHTGEILGVIGPNGAGKTTLFNVITGFLPPTSGTIRLRDQDITGKEPDRVTALGIARTFQNIRLFARMTVLDNVKTAQQLHGKAGFWETIFSTPSFLEKERALEERAYAHLESLGLARFAECLRRGAALRVSAQTRDRPRAGDRTHGSAAGRAGSRDERPGDGGDHRRSSARFTIASD